MDLQLRENEVQGLGNNIRFPKSELIELELIELLRRYIYISKLEYEPRILSNTFPSGMKVLSFFFFSRKRRKQLPFSSVY